MDPPSQIAPLLVNSRSASVETAMFGSPVGPPQRHVPSATFSWPDPDELFDGVHACPKRPECTHIGANIEWGPMRPKRR
jgi:hypothetical protein